MSHSVTAEKSAMRNRLRISKKKIFLIVLATAAIAAALITIHNWTAIWGALVSAGKWVVHFWQHKVYLDGILKPFKQIKDDPQLMFALVALSGVGVLLWLAAEAVLDRVLGYKRDYGTWFRRLQDHWTERKVRHRRERRERFVMRRHRQVQHDLMCWNRPPERPPVPQKEPERGPEIQPYPMTPGGVDLDDPGRSTPFTTRSQSTAMWISIAFAAAALLVWVGWQILS